MSNGSTVNKNAVHSERLLADFPPVYRRSTVAIYAPLGVWTPEFTAFSLQPVLPPKAVRNSKQRLR